jgi:hypothetical protein
MFPFKNAAVYLKPLAHVSHGPIPLKRLDLFKQRTSTFKSTYMESHISGIQYRRQKWKNQKQRRQWYRLCLGDP